MTPQFVPVSALLFSCLLALAANAVAEVPKEPETLRELIDQSLDWYQVFPSVEADEPCKTLTALRWANNSRGSEDGATLLFVSGGRPYAAACVYPWSKRLEHDFESLSRRPIVARREGRVVWQPQEAGVSFADIPGAQAPGESPAVRLRQMKTLTERFSAVMLGWKVDNSDRENLRLLPRPLYRYEPEGGEVLDGAVFAFAMGTDPEVLLLLEAVDIGGTPRWQFAFARRTSGELEGRLDNKPVWTAKRFPTQNDPAKAHYTRGTVVDPRYFEAAGNP